MNFADQLATRIQRAIGNSYHVVSRPDHPFLLASPDVIIGGNGRLSALFFISSVTKSSLLRARLSSARLALPSGTRMVAILREGQPDVENQLLENFDATFSAVNDCVEITGYCSGDALPRTDQNQMREVKRWHSISSSVSLEISLLRKKHNLESVGSRAVFDQLVESKNLDDASDFPAIRKKDTTLVTINKSEVAVLSGANRAADELKRIWRRGMNNGFILDTGVPYPDRDAQPNIVLIDEWPKNRSDPDKPIRAAAFSGWIMAMSSSKNEIEELIGRSQFTLKRRLSE